MLKITNLPVIKKNSLVYVDGFLIVASEVVD